jgi:D-glycero-alpha-D-manno-heptose-7-phosphate kinase
MANEHIDRLYAKARANGAIGGKLVGAGGGGFLLVYSDRPEEMRAAMTEEGAPELTFDFEYGGAYASENR